MLKYVDKVFLKYLKSYRSVRIRFGATIRSLEGGMGSQSMSLIGAPQFSTQILNVQKRSINF